MVGRFRVDFSNIRGLRANFFSVYAHICLHRPDVLALCETQVSEGADPQDFHVPGYHLISQFNLHRGLVLYIRNEVVYQCQQPYGMYDAEFSCLWVKFKIRTHLLHFGFLYRSPNAGREVTMSGFDSLSDSISRILENYPNSEIVVAGDFNVHNSTWLRHSGRTTPEGQYAELFAAHNHLVQLINEPTHISCVDGHQNNTLDLFLTSHPNKYEVEILAPLGNSDHCTISASFSFSRLHDASPTATKRSVFIYEKARWAELNDFFRHFNWKLCFLDSNIDAMAEMVVNIIKMGMNAFIPSKKILTKSRNKAWFNQTCKLAVRSREEAFRNWRNNKCAHTDALRNQARSSCAAVLRREKALYEQRLRTNVLTFPRGSKCFWSFVKRLGNNASSVPNLIKDDHIFTNPVEKANLFAELFASNSRLPESAQPLPELERISVTMPSIFFRARAVKRVLADLSIHKSSGPDGIPALVLKQCSSTLARPLANLFSASYRAGHFPSSWKIANVTPIPKKGEATNPENYRPIAVCSALSKVMESMINHHLVKYLESNHLLNDRQYGFRKGRSTGDLLALLTEKWNKSIHRFGESKVVALDISKAFDRVWHEALISKLTSFGVGNHFSRFISSFLKDRAIRVVIDGVYSNEFRLNSGVPQGSVLSPTLFLVFINDLLSVTLNPIYSFADDSNICHSYSFDRRPSLVEIGARRRNMNDSLTSDLLTISEWGRANRVDFNARKTQCCFLTHRRGDGNGVLPPVKMGNVNIEEADALDVLGMRINWDVRWNDHIFRVSKEAFKCLGFLKRCKKYFTPSDLLTIYKAYIRPRMEYNSHVWAGASKTVLRLLDRVQERAKVLINDSGVSNSIDSLEHRRNVACVTLFYRYYNGMCSDEIGQLMPRNHVFLRSTRTSRGAHPFVVDCSMDRTTHYRENSFFGRTARLWNNLPTWVFPANCDISRFKSNVHRHYSLFPPSHNLFS